jgi:hypothetical protein
MRTLTYPPYHKIWACRNSHNGFKKSGCGCLLLKAKPVTELFLFGFGHSKAAAFCTNTRRKVNIHSGTMADKKTRDLLKKNKHSPVLQLWLDKKSPNGVTAMALEKNTTVHTVSVFIEEGFMENSHEELMFLFDEIGRLPLRNLYIYSFGKNYDVFPIKLLIHLFDYAEHLKVLAMYFVELGGHERYFKTFGEIVKKHKHLKEFRLENCRLSANMLNTLAFDQFVTTFTTLPNIEKIELLAAEMGSLGLLTPPGLLHMAKCKTLTHLSLINFPFTNLHMTSLAEAINSNKNLTELAISCDPEYCTNLAPMLATNRTLEVVRLKLQELKNEVFLHRLAVGLKENKSITRFELTGEKHNRMSKKNQQDFASVLEKNQTIEMFEINFWDHDSRHKVQYYLKLNQTGKRDLMKNPEMNKDELVSALAYVGNDLDCLHHFIKTNPNVVHE